MHMHMNGVNNDDSNDLGPMPIDIGMLNEDTVVETNRIEYKECWNPEKVAHTICAFANDYENVDGGYIVIGVREVDGIPRTPRG